MSKFGFLKRTHIPIGESGWKWMQFPEINQDCELLLANATQENPAVLEAAMRHMDDRGAGERGGGQLKSKMDRSLDEDRNLILNYVLKGWKGQFEAQEEEPYDYILDADGAKVPIEFNRANAIDFLEQLPGYLLTRIKSWMMEPDNFVVQGPPSMPSGNNVGKG